MNKERSIKNSRPLSSSWAIKNITELLPPEIVPDVMRVGEGVTSGSICDITRGGGSQVGIIGCTVVFYVTGLMTVCVSR